MTLATHYFLITLMSIIIMQAAVLIYFVMMKPLLTKEEFYMLSLKLTLWALPWISITVAFSSSLYTLEELSLFPKIQAADKPEDVSMEWDSNPAPGPEVQEDPTPHEASSSGTQGQEPDLPLEKMTLSGSESSLDLSLPDSDSGQSTDAQYKASSESSSPSGKMFGSEKEKLSRTLLLKKLLGGYSFSSDDISFLAQQGSPAATGLSTPSTFDERISSITPEIKK